MVGWHWLGPIAHACAAITAAKPEPTESVLAAMCRAAELVSNPWSGAEVNNTLLGLVFPDPSTLGTDPRTGFRRVTPEELTPEQRQAIYAIGRAPVWQTEPCTTTAGSWMSGWSTACRGSRISIGRCLRRFGGQNPRGSRNDPA